MQRVVSPPGRRGPRHRRSVPKERGEPRLVELLPRRPGAVAGPGELDLVVRQAVTRDVDWGIPAPFPGAEGKTIYVWVEAVLGYVSATIEYCRRIGEPEKWREFWENDQTKS